MSTVGPPQHIFFAVERDGATERTVLLDIREQDEGATGYIQSVWQRMCLALGAFHKIGGSSCPGWVSWDIPKWSKVTPATSDRLKFVAWAGDTMAGFLHLRPAFPSPINPGQQVMYVENMAASPGNISTEIWERQLYEVGNALLGFAIRESQQRGFNGLLGLHATDDKVATYYGQRKSYGQVPLFDTPMTGIPGPSPHLDKHKSKQYFETTPAGAIAFVEDYLNGE